MKKLSFSILGLTTIMALSACNAAEKEQPSSSSDVGAASMASEINEEQRLLKEAQNQFIAGENFLNQNKNAKGVHTTPSGLQYKVNHQTKGLSLIHI